MKNINIIAGLLIVLIVSSNLISLKVLSQTEGSTPLDTYIITLTNKDGKTILNGPTSALNITTAPGGQNVAGLNPGVSFNGTGATTLLTNVDTAANLITVVWSGAVSDGKAVITGSLKQGSTIAPNFTVVKVEKDGGTDITNDVNIVVNLSSSTASSSSSSGSVSSSSSGATITSSSSGSSASEPSITLNAPDKFVVKKGSPNTLKIKVVGANFSSAAKCQIEVSDDSLFRVRPLKFLLSKSRGTKTLLAKVLPVEVKSILDSDSADVVTVDVSCSNDASDSIDITLAPNAQE